MDYDFLILSYDGFADCWELNVESLRRHGFDGNIYLLSNELYFSAPGLTNIKTGPEQSWSHSLVHALKCMENDYCLIWLDDVFLRDNYPHSQIHKLLNFAVKSKANYIRLKPWPPVPRSQKWISKCPAGERYRASLSPALWRKEHLLDLIKLNETPWEFELNGSKRAQHYDGYYRVRDDIFHIYHGILKGKWIRSSFFELSKKFPNNDFPRPIMSIGETIIWKIKRIRMKIFYWLPRRLQIFVLKVLGK